MAMAFNPDGSLANNKPSIPKEKTVSNRVSSVDEWNNIGTNYMKNYYVDQFKNIGAKDYNTQLDIVNKLRSFNLIDEKQRKDLQMGIIYNDRIAKGQGIDTQQLNISPFQQMVKDLGLQNVPVIKSVVKPFMPPESDINTIVKNNENLIGITTDYQKYINDLGQTVINTKGQQGVQQYNDALKQAEKIAKNNMALKSFYTSPSLFISSYNKMDSLGQRSLINDLQNMVTDYSNSSDKQLNKIAADAYTLHQYLISPAETQKQLNAALKLDANTPTANTRKDVITVALDFGRGAISKTKDWLNVVDQETRAILNEIWAKGNRTKLYFNPELQPFLKDKWTTNLNAYNSGQIDKRTYELNNARINDWFERSIGSDTSLKNRLLKTIGWTAFGGQFLIPSSSFLRGGAFALKSLFVDLGFNFALGSLSSYTDYKKDRPITVKDLLTNGSIAMVMAGIPYVIRGVRVGIASAATKNKIKAMPGGEALLAQLEGAPDQKAISKILNDAYRGNNPETVTELLRLAVESISDTEKAVLKDTLTEIAKTLDEVNKKADAEINLAGVAKEALTATEPTTAQAVTEVTTTPVTTQATTAVTETPAVSTQIAEEIAAKKNVFIEDTGTKVGNAKEFRIVDTNGKNLGVIKANTIEAATARLKQIQQSPTRYSKQYPKVFETPKQRVVETARVTKEKVSAPKPTPTAVKRPNFMPEAYTVLEKERTLPNGKLTREFVLRDAQGREIRRLTTSEIRTYREYTKARAEAYKASQAISTTTSKLEAARAQAPKVEAKPTTKPTEGKTLTVDYLRERPTIKNGKPVIQTIDSEGNVVKTTVLYDPNKQGKTYTVYRGSGEGKKVTTQYGLSILGNDKKYYAFTEDVAKKFGNKVEKTEVTLRNPIEITNDAQWREISKEAGNKFPNPTGLTKAETAGWIANIDRYLKSKGYDGVVIRFAKGEDTTLIRRVFGDEQVVPFGAAPKAPVTTIATEMGGQKPTVIKEAQPVKVEVPAKPKPEPKLTRSIPGIPEQGIPKGVIRQIYDGIDKNVIERAPTTSELATYTKERFAPYKEKYIKDLQQRPDYVIDVVSGKVEPTGKFQKEVYTYMLEEASRKMSGKDWWELQDRSNLLRAKTYSDLSESAQNMSLASYFGRGYDTNAIIHELNTSKQKTINDTLKNSGKSLKDEIKVNRAAIEAAIPKIKNEDAIALVKTVKGEKSNLLLQAFIKDSTLVERLAKMTSNERLAALAEIVGEDYALRYAASFEEKLLLKNQKIGLINWVRTSPIKDPVVKKDIIDQINTYKNLLEPANAGGFDNLIETKLGARLTKETQIKIHDLQVKMLESESKVIGPEGRYKTIEEFQSAALQKDYKKPYDVFKWGYDQALLSEYVNNVRSGGNFKEWLAKEREAYQSLKEFKKLGFVLNSLNNLQKTLGSALDNSFLLRQGASVAKINPRIWLQGSRKSIYALVDGIKNPALAKRLVLADILSDPFARQAAADGLAIMGKSDYFGSGLPERIPGLGRAYSASELAFEASANKMRLELYKKWYTNDMKKLAEVGMPEDYPKNLSRMINSLTGQGDFNSPLTKNALNVFFYSAGFMRSQVDKLLLHPLGIGIGGIRYKDIAGKNMWNPVAQKAAFNLMKIVATTASMMAVANAIKPGSAELDPRSADFGKIKVGDTRFDITGGMNQFVVLGARLLPIIINQGYIKNSNTGVLTKLNLNKFGSKDGFQVAIDFFTNKNAPNAALVVSTFRGQDVTRTEPSLGKIAKRALLPMTAQNVIELYSNPNRANAFWATFFDLLGASANTYGYKGAGSAGSSWDSSTAEDVAEFKTKVGKTRFNEAAQKFDDKLNTSMNKLRNSTDYKNLSDDAKRKLLTKMEAQAKQEIFSEYGFKYKAAPTTTKLEDETIKNLINQNL